jgi:thiol:disulfide interchange protein DsbG
MRAYLLATAMVMFPFAAFAQPHCALSLPIPMQAEAPIELQPPITLGGAPIPLMPAAAPITPMREQPHPKSPPATSQTSADLTAIPALAHITAAGATLSDLGMSHGLRTVSGRHGAQVMVFEVSPDGQAAVAGLMTDLSVNQLRAIGGKDLTELPPQHGLRAFFLRNGPQFQVFYATPDHARVIPGVMWDAAGKDLTRDQVAAIPGTVPTVTIGADPTAGNARVASADQVTGTPPLIAVAQSTASGSVGNSTAPELWMFMDPQCSFSVRAMQQLTPLITAGKVQLHVIPLSILDGEDNGLSTRRALNLLSMQSDQLVAAWENGQMTGTPSSDASGKLQMNMAAAASIHLQGTPTLIWRKADGSAGRLDGIPPDMGGLVASIGR